VVIAQGSLQIKADRVEIKAAPPGRLPRPLPEVARSARPSFRQKRDRVDETVEAEALRVEYDGANEKVRFVGDAKMRRGAGQRPGGRDHRVRSSPTTNAPSTIVFEGGTPPSVGATARAGQRCVFIPRNAEAAASPAGQVNAPDATAALDGRAHGHQPA
jgi:lipopolysaccharide export system protein LptA